jgi:hypothetical protein
MAINQVIKLDGEKEEFDRNQFRESLIRARVPVILIDDIYMKLEKKFSGEVSTTKIYDFVTKILKSQHKHSLPRYATKRSLLTLGPSGFPFEMFLAKIFEAKGYTTTVGAKLKGKCVPHEVDIVAKNENELLLVEVKFHNKTSFKTDTKVALYIKARWDDLKNLEFVNENGPNKMTRGMIVTNTKFTNNAKRYGHCVGMDMISFDYPKNGNLYDMMEETGLHPITCLSNLTNVQKEEIMNNGIITCSDLKKDDMVLDSIKMNKNKKRNLLDEMESVC